MPSFCVHGHVRAPHRAQVPPPLGESYSFFLFRGPCFKGPRLGESPRHHEDQTHGQNLADARQSHGDRIRRRRRRVDLVDTHRVEEIKRPGPDHEIRHNVDLSDEKGRTYQTGVPLQGP